jgi:hypothetical protein
MMGCIDSMVGKDYVVTRNYVHEGEKECSLSSFPNSTHFSSSFSIVVLYQQRHKIQNLI